MSVQLILYFLCPGLFTFDTPGHRRLIFSLIVNVRQMCGFVLSILF